MHLKVRTACTERHAPRTCKCTTRNFIRRSTNSPVARHLRSACRRREGQCWGWVDEARGRVASRRRSFSGVEMSLPLSHPRGNWPPLPVAAIALAVSCPPPHNPACPLLVTNTFSSAVIRKKRNV